MAVMREDGIVSEEKMKPVQAVSITGATRIIEDHMSSDQLSAESYAVIAIYYGSVVFVVNGRTWRCRCEMRELSNGQERMYKLDVFDRDSLTWREILCNHFAHYPSNTEWTDTVHDWINAHMHVAIEIVDGD